MPVITAALRLSNKIGMMKIIAKMNLKKNVEIELSQISFVVIDLLPDSSEMCTPFEQVLLKEQVFLMTQSRQYFELCNYLLMLSFCLKSKENLPL